MSIDSHEGTRISLGQLASIEQAFGPGAIRREAGSRRVAVEASATGRDLGGVAADIQQTLQRDLQLPQGYFLNVGGRVESQARASRSLMTAIALALFAVVLLLYFALDPFTEAAVILVTIPVAFVGGIAGLTADIALLAGDLRKIPWLIRHSRRAVAIMRQNITLSLAVKALFVLLTFAGHASLWAAIAADMGATLVVGANALRLLRDAETT